MVVHMLPNRPSALRVTVAVFVAAVLGVCAVGFGAPMVASPLPTEVDPGDAAAELFADTNIARSSAGVAPLTRDAGLDALAAQWAQEMAASGSLEHRDGLGAATVSFVGADGWTFAAENVGRGPTVAAVADAFIASDDHRVNVEDPQLVRVGVGVAVDDGGQLWVAVNFTD